MPSAPLAIRPALRSDLKAADALERANFTSFPISARQLRYLQDNPRAIFLVATKDREIVGDAIALVRRNYSAAPSGRIYSIVVEPAHRGEKIGVRLLAGLIDELKRRCVGHISLEVEKSNVPAIALYQRLGFALARPLPHYYGRSRHGIRMTLDLNAL
ncbi:MAG TPA: GNAT family N-acetyltransferase [Tepidisphaeraceae bacterium]|jgi:ribosomal protein S18 acetylase RimI-like enzyme|nr:GNAT family N-acetyltransferase [Tepidisphaeraceae bacterium]